MPTILAGVWVIHHLQSVRKRATAQPSHSFGLRVFLFTGPETERENKEKERFLQSFSLPLASGVKNKESFVWFSLFLSGEKDGTLPGSHREIHTSHSHNLSEKIPSCWFKGQPWGQSFLCPDPVHQLIWQWVLIFAKTQHEAAVTHRERLFGQHNSLNLWHFCFLIGPVLSGQTTWCFWRLLYSLNQMIWISSMEKPHILLQKHL